MILQARNNVVEFQSQRHHLAILTVEVLAVVGRNFTGTIRAIAAAAIPEIRSVDFQKVPV
jgi:hypothetical protein